MFLLTSSGHDKAQENNKVIHTTNVGNVIEAWSNCRENTW